MRGGAQAHLLEADDGQHYAVKSLNNPQHRWVPVNEWLGSAILRHAGILTPETRIVHISKEFVRAYPDMHFQLHRTRVPPVAGFHFGSRFPGDPDHVSVYDFVPECIFSSVANRAAFLGVLVLDKWMANTDARQAIFYRPPTSKRRLVASMIDNGLLFGGPHWDFVDPPLFDLARSRAAYADVSAPSLDPWFNLVGSFPEEVLFRTAHQMPPERPPSRSDHCLRPIPAGAPPPQPCMAAGGNRQRVQHSLQQREKGPHILT
jgi:hypothetical protein